MIEALYGIKFSFDQYVGCGVVILETQRILGGDSSFIFIGNYEICNGTLKANVEVKNNYRVLESIVGLDEYTVVVEGSIENYNEFILVGSVQERPGMPLKIEFTRKAELP